MGEEIVTAPVLLVRLLAGLIGESRRVVQCRRC
jgi:hypothetical protein